MKLLRSFPILAFTLVLLSIAGLAAAQHSITMLLVPGTLAAMSWYLTEGPRGRTLPKWVSNVLVIAASLYVFVDLLQNHEDLMGVLGRFAVWLTLIKLYERRTARDHAHLLTLSLLLIMTGCLQSSELLFGVILICYVALGLYVLLLYQLYAAFEESRNSRQTSMPRDYRLLGPVKPIIGRRTDFQLRTQAVVIGMFGVALSVLVFVTFPRDVGAGLFSALSVPRGPRTPQFMWEIDLRVGGRISDSLVRVMSVQVTDKRGVPVQLPEPLYLRGAALDDYKGKGQWRGLSGDRRQRDPLPVRSDEWFQLTSSTPEEGETYVQEFTTFRAQSGDAPLFSMYAPVAVSSPSPFGFWFDQRRQTLKTEGGARRVMHYSVKARPMPNDAELRSIGENVRSSRAAWFSEKDRETLRALAFSILEKQGVPTTNPPDSDPWAWNVAAAAAFTKYLQSQGGFSYTLDLSSVVYAGRNDDPIVDFLTRTKRGHCEFFASGLAALCNSVDIPSRVMAGYLAYHFDSSRREYDVLASNAHAWVEVGSGKRSWTTFDPTPEAFRTSTLPNQASFVDSFRELYQDVEGNWSNNFIGFDGAVQADLAESIHRTWSARIAGALESVRNWMEEVNTFFNVGPGGYIWMGIVALALAIAVVALVKLMRRSFAMKRTMHLQHVRGAAYRRMLRQLGFYLDMLTVLRRHGIEKPVWQPPMEFAHSLGNTSPRAARLVGAITDAFYKCRFGDRALDARSAEKVQTLVRQLDRTLRRGTQATV